mmetsp:Transcript_23247/g.75608  ORF Transcript_23247/g.75608 Transcript_23247/m.75608 type:complete len:294 (+) Transcript_23247:269-1150(+)
MPPRPSRLDNKRSSRDAKDTKARAKSHAIQGNRDAEKLQVDFSSTKSSMLLPLALLLVIGFLGYYFHSHLNDDGHSGGSKRMSRHMSSGLDDRKKSRANLQAMLEKVFPGHQAVAKAIMTEVLDRNVRKMQSNVVEKALVLHFAGNPAEYSKMESVVIDFVLGHPYPAVLHLGRNLTDWDDVREAVFKHLLQHPRCVVVLHEADRAPFESLYNLEDAFENSEFEFAGERVDCRHAIFVLQTSFVKNLKDTVCSGEECTSENRNAMVHNVKMASQSFWTRQAFVARIRDIVPFV